MNKLNKENGDRLIDREQDDSYWGYGVEGLSKKEGLMDVYNSVVIAAGRGV